MSYLNRRIALPQDHGSWVFILSPLLIGLFAGQSFNLASLALVIAAMSAFLARQPISIFVKVIYGRRPQYDLSPALFWTSVYGLTFVVAVAGLVHLGYAYILILAVPALPVFVWHLYLVSRRSERRQSGVEIVATGALALAAPAAYWIGIGEYSSLGWSLWLLTWLQSAASIIHAYMRLEQRDQLEMQDQNQNWRIGKQAFIYTTFNVTFSLSLALLKISPPLTFIPFLLQWIETVWCIVHPAVGVKATSIGIRQLVVSILFTILFILTWQYS